jgi:hypothetical protein
MFDRGIAIDDRFGMKALVVACHLGNIDIIQCLTKIYNVNVMIEGQPEWDASTNDWRRPYDYCRTVKYPVGKDYSAFLVH